LQEGQQSAVAADYRFQDVVSEHSGQVIEEKGKGGGG